MFTNEMNYLNNILDNEIEILKKDLKQSIMVNGFTNHETLLISNKIDKYILEYQHLKLGIDNKIE